jgi:uncharacterized membrane protein
LVLAFYGIEDWDFTFLVVAGVEAVTFTIASLLYVRAVTLSPLSLTIPYLGFTPVVSAAVALGVLREIPSSTGLIGILLVVIGAVALHTGENETVRSLLSAPFREPGSWRMLLVAIIWGTTTSLDKIAIRHGSEALLAFTLTAVSSVILVGWKVLNPWVGLASAGSTTRWSNRKTLLLLLVSALVAGLAVLCQFFAYRELLVAYVETIKRAGGLLSVLIGVTIFREVGWKNRLPAATLMVVGIVLILLR